MWRGGIGESLCRAESGIVEGQAGGRRLRRAAGAGSRSWRECRRTSGRSFVCFISRHNAVLLFQPAVTSSARPPPRLLTGLVVATATNVLDLLPHSEDADPSPRSRPRRQSFQPADGSGDVGRGDAAAAAVAKTAAATAAIPPKDFQVLNAFIPSRVAARDSCGSGGIPALY